MTRRDDDGPAGGLADAAAGAGGGVERDERDDPYDATGAPGFLGKGAIPEGELSEMLGLSRDDLRERRQAMRRGVEWAKEGRTVVWAAATVEALREELGLPQGPSEKKGAGPEEGEELVVEVVPRNRRLVMARTPGGDVVRVRVRDNRNFVRGMQLHLCVHEQADVWAHQGRCPRWKGRY